MIIDRTTKNIAGWIEAFLGDRKAIGLSPHTVAFYRQRLRLLTDYTDSVGLHYMDQLDADSIRAWLIWLADTGHNPGGVHGCYRSLASDGANDGDGSRLRLRKQQFNADLDYSVFIPPIYIGEMVYLFYDFW